MHELSITREVAPASPEIGFDGQVWATIRSTGEHRAACPCGIDTGTTDFATAATAFLSHQGAIQTP